MNRDPKSVNGLSVVAEAEARAPRRRDRRVSEARLRGWWQPAARRLERKRVDIGCYVGPTSGLRHGATHHILLEAWGVGGT